MLIKKATVLIRVYGCDIVLLWTDYPSSMPKVTDQNLCLRFDAEKDTGYDYVTKHFGIIPEVIRV